MKDILHLLIIRAVIGLAVAPFIIAGAFILNAGGHAEAPAATHVRPDWCTSTSTSTVCK